MNQEKIGKFIMTMRQKKKITQEELAQKLGVTDKAVSKWENGRCMPDISLLEPLAGELGITINELIKGEIIENKSLKIKTDENLKMCLKESKNNRQKVKILSISIVVAILLYHILVLSISEVTHASVISFSSFKVMRKADKFYEALVNRDYNAIRNMLTMSEDLWHPKATNGYSTETFIENLDKLDIEYTKFKLVGFRWSGSNPAAVYDLCFIKDYNRGCISIEIILEKDDSIDFLAQVLDANELEDEVIDVFNPIWNLE